MTHQEMLIIKKGYDFSKWLLHHTVEKIGLSLSGSHFPVGKSFCSGKNLICTGEKIGLSLSGSHFPVGKSFCSGKNLICTGVKLCCI